jgi:FkbM family methyltransferase
MGVMRTPRPADVWRIVRAFADWPRLLSDYAALTSPARQYALRAGRLIETHGLDRADVATLFVIFGREEYGRIPRDAAVLDLGANIGAFAVFAAQQGARVYSFEPEPSNYRLLFRNVPPSVSTFDVAVTGRKERRRLFLRSSPSHSLYERRADESSLGVECIPLEVAIRRCDLEKVDLLKLDVEGSEYEILYSASDALLAVNEIRMEYHQLPGKCPPNWHIHELRNYLAGLGLAPILFRPLTDTSGIAWFRRN